MRFWGHTTVLGSCTTTAGSDVPKLYYSDRGFSTSSRFGTTKRQQLAFGTAHGSPWQAMSMAVEGYLSSHVIGRRRSEPGGVLMSLGGVPGMGLIWRVSWAVACGSKELVIYGFRVRLIAPDVKRRGGLRSIRGRWERPPRVVPAQCFNVVLTMFMDDLKSSRRRKYDVSRSARRSYE